MNEEKIYQFNEYVLGYDKGLGDRSCLTISKVQNDSLYVMASLCDGSADVISTILDNLQSEINKLKETNEEHHKINGQLREELQQEKKDFKETNDECFRLLKENQKLVKVIEDLETKDDVLEEFEDWLENQKYRNSEWENFARVDNRMGIPIHYILDKLNELKGGSDE